VEGPEIQPVARRKRTRRRVDGLMILHCHSHLLQYSLVVKLKRQSEFEAWAELCQSRPYEELPRRVGRESRRLFEHLQRKASSLYGRRQTDSQHPTHHAVQPCSVLHDFPRPACITHDILLFDDPHFCALIRSVSLNNSPVRPVTCRLIRSLKPPLAMTQFMDLIARRPRFSTT
jgi:hypothetical protein